MIIYKKIDQLNQISIIYLMMKIININLNKLIRDNLII